MKTQEPIHEPAQAPIVVRVQEQDFDLGQEYELLRERSFQSGAIVLFTGLVRDFNACGAIDGIVLEHYPAMTTKALCQIGKRALKRWQLEAVTVLHRVGRLHNQDQIVLVGVAARHRSAAFEAAQFIMDYLKTQAPLWKKEISAQGCAEWVDAKDSDQRSRERWATDLD